MAYVKKEKGCRLSAQTDLMAGAAEFTILCDHGLLRHVWLAMARTIIHGHFHPQTMSGTHLNIITMTNIQQEKKKLQIIYFFQIFQILIVKSVLL